ncbi:MAG: aldehyde dehydrogenase [Luminiphilus sp.]|nr:aldehyde dehydrogenase [Luminiphilus sp.]
MASPMPHIEASKLTIPDVITGHVAGLSALTNSSATLLPVHFPGTGESIASLQEDAAAQVNTAVSAARARFHSGEWSQCTTTEKQRVFRAAAQAIRNNAHELALQESLCAGLPFAHLASRQIPRAADNFDFFADYIGQLAGETYDQLHDYRTVVTRQPAGVAAIFTPWNACLALSSMQIASCIAFGNSCVLKPSEFAPLAVLQLVRLLESAGLPSGVVNIVNGRGSVTGAALATAEGVDRIALTGRGNTARKVMAAAAARLTPVHFELEGNSANIIFDDADLDRAIDGALLSAFGNSGQICIAGSRILVQKNIADRFIEAFVARTKDLQVGDPLDDLTEVGPMAFAQHQQKILNYFALAENTDATLLTGGRAMPELGSGYFVAPTIFKVADNRSPLCQEEIFGPVVTIQIFNNDEDAWTIANDSRFGLIGYCWTESLRRAQAFQQRVDAGTLWLNTPIARDLRAPFGGFKASGIGRDGPRQAADFFTEEKATIAALGQPAIRKMGLGKRTKKDDAHS